MDTTPKIVFKKNYLVELTGALLALSVIEC